MGVGQRLWARAVGQDVAEHFRFATHRAVLAVLLAVAFVLQTALSLDGARPGRLVEQQLLENESDANSVVAVQRDSYTVALALADWTHGAATAREVQIARALLSQRLSVVTRSQTLTAENVSPDYLAALAELDEFLRALTDAPVADRMEVAAAFEPTVQTFLSEARALNEVFQRLGREQVQLLVDANRARQQQQTVLQLTIILLVGLLSLSIVVSVGRGYRSVAGALRREREAADRARRRLDLVRALDQRLSPLAAEVDAGKDADAVLAGLRTVLDAIGGGWIWTLPDVSSDGTVTATASSDTGGAERDGMLLDREDVELVQYRAQGLVTAVRRREATRRASEQQRRRDTLTGLSNRIGFSDALQHLLDRRDGDEVLVAFVDIDRFGEVNGALGFNGADRVLIDLANRLVRTLQGTPGAVVARMAADEFAIAVPVGGEAAANLVMDEVRAVGTYLADVDDLDVQISVSVGEAVSAGLRTTAAELMRRAAVAMILAKEPGERRGRVRFHAEEHAHLSQTLSEESAVRNALRSGEFRMYYQPIVDLERRAAVGVEALARWERPGVGLVPPGEFLPVIRRSGFALEFGYEVLSEILTVWSRSLRAALSTGADAAVSVSANVDADLLADPSFESFLRSALDRVGMDPHELVLELTEHAAIEPSFAPLMARLRTLGVQFAIDDFGTGYSSLGQIANLPIDVVKLDRSFIVSTLEQGGAPGLIADIARMGRTLDVRMVAEGIETEEVVSSLRTAGVRLGQGFLFSPALPEEDVVRWIATAARPQPQDVPTS